MGIAVRSPSGVQGRAPTANEIHFGPTKSLENASCGCKRRTLSLIFFTEHRRSHGTPVEKHGITVSIANESNSSVNKVSK